METEQHPIREFLSMVPLHTSLSYQSDVLKKQLHCEEVVLPRGSKLEPQDGGPCVFEVEHLVDEAI
jgi:hypothetical protein